MSNHPTTDSIFATASEIESAEARDAYPLVFLRAAQPGARFGVYTITGTGERKFHGFAVIRDRNPIRGWLILDMTDDDTIRYSIHMGDWTYRNTFPSPVPPMKAAVEKPSDFGTCFTPSGTRVTPGDVLFRFSSQGRIESDPKKVLKGHVGISFGFVESEK